jgi:hypothetical protein
MFVEAEMQKSPAGGDLSLAFYHRQLIGCPTSLFHAAKSHPIMRNPLLHCTLDFSHFAKPLSTMRYNIRKPLTANDIFNY